MKKEEINVKKRGLVIIYDPHALMQFLQFYCMGDYDAEWDALCLPKEDGEEEMHAYCERTGIFRNIFTGTTEYKNLSIGAKLKLFIPMVLYALAGHRIGYCRKTLNAYVDSIDAYDVLVANSENGFVSGMIASFGKKKDVVYFEDGLGDYTWERHKWKSVYPSFSFDNLQCILMSRLGYFGKGYTKLQQARDCVRYASIKSAFVNSENKEVREFKLDGSQLEQYQTILIRTYPELKDFHVGKDSVILFTDAYEELGNDYEIYKEKIVRYINRNEKSVILKQHPREKKGYVFDENIKVINIPKNIPGEILFPFLGNKRCYISHINSLILNMKTYGIRPIIFWSDCFHKELIKITPGWPDRDKTSKMCELFCGMNYDIIDVD